MVCDRDKEDNVTEYIHFTEEQKEQARCTDLVALLKRSGEKLKRSGSEYQWKSNDEKVTVRGNLWFHQYEQEGGDAIDFVQRFYHMDFPQAVSFLLSEQGVVVTREKNARRERKPFELPKANQDMRRVYAYLLKGRFLDRDIVSYFVRQKQIYEDAEYHNVIFVGMDKEGIPRHAHKRGTYSESEFKGNVDGSLPEYSFHYIGTGNKLYVFEAPVDMLSYISMHKKNWQENSYVCLCSVAPQAVVHILKNNPQIDTIAVCLDHDKAGIEGDYRIAEAVQSVGNHYKLEPHLPPYKDWNEGLKAEHGIQPLPAVEHPGIQRMKVLCQELTEECMEDVCPKYPIEELQQQYQKIKQMISLKSSEVTKQSHEMSRVAFLFAKKQLAAMEKGYDTPQYAKAMLRLYPPHHDNCGYKSRVTEIGERLQELKKIFDKNEILSESQQMEVAKDILSLSVDCLRLSMYAENQQEGSEVPCPVLHP